MSDNSEKVIFLLAQTYWKTNNDATRGELACIIAVSYMNINTKDKKMETKLKEIGKTCDEMILEWLQASIDHGNNCEFLRKNCEKNKHFLTISTFLNLLNTYINSWHKEKNTEFLKNIYECVVKDKN